MPRVLRGVDVGVAPRALVAPSPAEDPAVRAVLDAEVAAAYERGRVDGEAAGRQAALQTQGQVAQALQAALAEARAASGAVETALAARLTELAVEVARAVVGELDPNQLGTLQRVKAAIEAIDDRPLTVRVHPDDVPAVWGSVDSDVEVTEDATLQPGEARITGRWADADLTWDAVWSAVREALDVQ